MKEINMQFAKDLIEQGYQKAATSFSTFSGVSISTKKVELWVTSYKDLLSKIGEFSEATILLTEIIGDVKGKSFLILNEYESEKICDLLLEKLKSFENNDYYKDIILKELDNVLAASVITEFSNQLDIKIYGDVPIIFKPKENVQKWFKAELEKCVKMTVLISNCTFQFENDFKIKPSFVWILDDEFTRTLNIKSKNYEKPKIA